MAAVVGAVAFGFVWLPSAFAALYCNPSGPANMCKGTVTSNNVPVFLQPTMLAGGARCGACTKPPTSPVNGP